MSIIIPPHPHGNEATARLQAARDLMHSSVLSIITVTSSMQEVLAQIPDSTAKTRLYTLVSELYQYCGFEDLASQHITQAISLYSGIASSDTLLNGPAIHKNEGMSQEEIDRLLE